MLELNLFLVVNKVNAQDQQNYFCVLKIIKKSTKEMIQTSYGMGNIGDGVDLNELCFDFFCRDIATQGSDLFLIDSEGKTASNPDSFWLQNNWRRPLTEQELEEYSCLWMADNFLGVLSENVTSALPETPNNLRIPSLLLVSLAEFNSPILRFLVLQAWSTALPILGIASVVKLYGLIKR